MKVEPDDRIVVVDPDRLAVHIRRQQRVDVGKDAMGLRIGNLASRASRCWGIVANRHIRVVDPQSLIENHAGGIVHDAENAMDIGVAMGDVVRVGIDSRRVAVVVDGSDHAGKRIRVILRRKVAWQCQRKALGGIGVVESGDRT